jgi:aminoglycoside phosphotransferase (APT) family kinase protein
MVGIEPTGAELIRIGSNAVYWLRHRSIVARVGRRMDQFNDVAREIAVSRWLLRVGVHAVHALDVSQPVLAEGHPVSVWESVNDREEYGSTKELGELLKALHALPTPSNIDLPALDPFDRLRWRIDRVAVLSARDRAFLSSRHADLAAAYTRLDYVLPEGVVHGDASVGNVLRGRDGVAVLADLDGFAYGAREWDLIQTAMYYERYGWHTRDEYDAFVSAYGFDVMTWNGYPVLADIKELSMVTWMAQNAGSNVRAVGELAKRVRALRTGGRRDDWSPF